MACYTIITEAFGKRFAVSSLLFINILYPFHLLGISAICTADPFTIAKTKCDNVKNEM